MDELSHLDRRQFLKLLQIMPLAMVRQPLAVQPDTSKPNILVMVFDTLSARHMSLYGYPRHTTPQLERIAEEAIVYHNHYAAGNFTTPATASLLTGYYPWSHRAFQALGDIQQDLARHNLFEQFTEDYQTFSYTHNNFANILLHQFQPGIDDFHKRPELMLYSSHYADRFFNKDFKIFAHAEGLALWPDEGKSSTHILSRLERTRLYTHQAMLNQQYEEEFPRGVPNFHTTYFTIEDAIGWIKKQLQHQPKPFLGYIHLYPPHFPYTTRREFIDIFDDDVMPPEKPESVFTEKRDPTKVLELRRHYDEYIPYVDAEFARLFDHMKAEGLLENTYLIFTSDHGELFERGIWMHFNPVLYQPLIKVPLLIWGPGINQRVDVFHNTNCVDLLPTLRQLADLPGAIPGEGTMLPPFNDTPDPERSMYAVEAKENPVQAPLRQATIAMMKGNHKLIHYFGYPGINDHFEFFDLEADPEELVDLYPASPHEAIKMREELMDRLSDINQRQL